MSRRVVLLPALVAFLVGAAPASAWTWPVDGPVLQQFQLGEDPYAAGQHRGVDIGAATGTPVRAPAAGRVTFVGTVPRAGRTVTIETADGFSVTLLHLGSAGVSRGASVYEGEEVGSIGTSGDVEHSQPYVHLGVRLAIDPDGYLDPLSFLPPGAQGSAGAPSEPASSTVDEAAEEPQPAAGQAPPQSTPADGDSGPAETPEAVVGVPEPVPSTPEATGAPAPPPVAAPGVAVSEPGEEAEQGQPASSGNSDADPGPAQPGAVEGNQDAGAGFGHSEGSGSTPVALPGVSARSPDGLGQASAARREAARAGGGVTPRGPAPEAGFRGEREPAGVGDRATVPAGHEAGSTRSVDAHSAVGTTAGISQALGNGRSLVVALLMSAGLAALVMLALRRRPDIGDRIEPLLPSASSSPSSDEGAPPAGARRVRRLEVLDDLAEAA